ncbi:acylglycerol kinase, mitochondrial [Chrysoperla carnea]|uniref:acylglycerol kinase, mitochondrial n=1 Tax=Chrysoperla carnea TaxID=189513 RepID=UPI001D06C731|nr:acylglycerol kinase, mitochondrial [Chrysoperla carnea]
MSAILTGVKTIREHWKKSILFSVLAYYGVDYLKDKFETNELMRVYCEEAVRFGNETTSVLETPRNITVILNPSANKAKAKVQFEKYCAPILHLAGLSVNVILTESEGHAKRILEKLDQTEAVVIGGGDGTVSEVITGLLRRCNNDASQNHVPVGVLPLGRSNTLAASLFPGGDKLSVVRSLADATMAVVKQNTKPIDLMKIEVQDDTNSKPVYAVNEIEWGVFRDARAVQDKYWYFGKLRNYATYIFNASQINSPYEATLVYSLPCPGCKNCKNVISNSENKWWKSLFGRSTSKQEAIQYVNVNPQCNQLIEKDVATTSISLRTTNTMDESNVDVPQLCINVGPDKIDYIDFVKQGVSQQPQIIDKVAARQVQLKPGIPESEEELSIDNESFELKPITVTLLPKAIKVFTK